ncbi:hypothetical protein CYMTET_29459, partial [Cymbomonas tetramitiformis]
MAEHRDLPKDNFAEDRKQKQGDPPKVGTASSSDEAALRGPEELQLSLSGPTILSEHEIFRRTQEVDDYHSPPPAHNLTNHTNHTSPPPSFPTTPPPPDDLVRLVLSLSMTSYTYMIKVYVTESTRPEEPLEMSVQYLLSNAERDIPYHLEDSGSTMAYQGFPETVSVAMRFAYYVPQYEMYNPHTLYLGVHSSSGQYLFSMQRGVQLRAYPPSPPLSPPLPRPLPWRARPFATPDPFPAPPPAKDVHAARGRPLGEVGPSSTASTLPRPPWWEGREMCSVGGAGEEGAGDALGGAGDALWGDGRLEVYHEDRWGTVCDTRELFTDVEASVACRQEGYVGGQLGGAVVHDEVPPPPASAVTEAPIWMGGVNCTGWETVLWGCDFDGWGQAGEGDFAENCTDPVPQLPNCTYVNCSVPEPTNCTTFNATSVNGTYVPESVNCTYVNGTVPEPVNCTVVNCTWPEPMPNCTRRQPVSETCTHEDDVWLQCLMLGQPEDNSSHVLVLETPGAVWPPSKRAPEPASTDLHSAHNLRVSLSRVGFSADTFQIDDEGLIEVSHARYAVDGYRALVMQLLQGNQTADGAASNRSGTPLGMSEDAAMEMRSFVRGGGHMVVLDAGSERSVELVQFLFGWPLRSAPGEAPRSPRESFFVMINTGEGSCASEGLRYILTEELCNAAAATFDLDVDDAIIDNSARKPPMNPYGCYYKSSNGLLWLNMRTENTNYGFDGDRVIFCIHGDEDPGAELTGNETGVVDYPMTAEGANLTISEHLPSIVPAAWNTSLLDSMSLPDGVVPLYGNESINVTAVARAQFGLGHVSLLGFDWYQAPSPWEWNAVLEGVLAHANDTDPVEIFSQPPPPTEPLAMSAYTAVMKISVQADIS